jgi:hypothetical protein
VPPTAGEYLIPRLKLRGLPETKTLWGNDGSGHAAAQRFLI